jgi:hypothetical protein
MRYTIGMRVRLAKPDPDGQEVAIGECGTVVRAMSGTTRTVGVQWDKATPRRHNSNGRGVDGRCWNVPPQRLEPEKVEMPAEFKAFGDMIVPERKDEAVRLLFGHVVNREEKTREVIAQAIALRDEELRNLRNRFQNTVLLPRGCGGWPFVNNGLLVMNLWGEGVCVAKKATVHFKQYSVDGICAALPKKLQLKQEGWLVARFNSGGDLIECTLMDPEMHDSMHSFHSGSSICTGSLTAKLNRTMKLADPNAIRAGLDELEKTLELINTDSLLNEPSGDEFADLRQFIDDAVGNGEEEEEEEPEEDE